MAPVANGSSSRASCSHLKVTDSNLKNYALGLKWGRQIKRGQFRKDEEEEDNHQQDSYSSMYEQSKRRKLLPYPSCAICESPLHRPYLCLECALPACFYTQTDSTHDCIQRHLENSKHLIAFNMFDGTLFCSQCDQSVSDSQYISIADRETNLSRDKSTRSNSSKPSADSIDETIPSICRVPRGLYNLGASCFMNVILQSFVQNPLLRNYFLSDRHHAALCPARENCLACELDKLFTEFFSEKPSIAPYAPTNFLFCIYLARESTEVSTGAGEHDAHELFISALNNIHSALMAVGREPSTRSDRLPIYPHGDQAYGYSASRSGTASNASDDEDDTGQPKTYRFNSDIMCPCVVHRTFAGVLQSDVTCQRCGWTSTAHDPFLDLSLDIRTNRARTSSLLLDADIFGDFSTKKKSKKQKEREEKERKERLLREGSGIDDEQSLIDCMRRYCALEKLEKSDYSCHQCGIGSTAVKQLSLCRLPPVLCFQLKRFEHHSSTGTKIETRVKFPLVFDVREYCTNGAITVSDDSHHSNNSSSSSNYMDPDSFLYDLFTVIVHEGKLNTGHYYCYFQWRQTWYIANDDSVKPAKLDQVLSCKAYQLCYLRRRLQNVRPL